MRPLFTLALVGAFGLAGEAAAQAVEQEPLYASEPRVVGVGVGARFEPYRDLENSADAFPVPVVYFRYRFVTLAGSVLRATFYEDDDWQVSAVGEYRFGGFDDDDSPVFIGMEERKGTIEAGLSATYDIEDEIYLRAAFLHDILGRHEGFELRGTASYAYRPHISTEIEPYIGISFRSEDQTNYYYGIEDDEARFLTIDNDTFCRGTLVDIDGDGAGDATCGAGYFPGETLTPFVGINARQALSRKIVVVGTGRVEILPSEIEDSPLVDNAIRAFGGVAIGYMF